MYILTCTISQVGVGQYVSEALPIPMRYATTTNNPIPLVIKIQVGAGKDQPLSDGVDGAGNGG